MRRDWFQILSNIAVLVGIIIVLFELNQQRQFTHGELLAEEFARVHARNVALMGESPGPAVVRASLCPEQLSAVELASLHGFYSTIVLGWVSIKSTATVSGLDRSWESAVRLQGDAFLGSEPARRWLRAWAETSPFVDAELKSVIDAQLSASADDRSKPIITALFDSKGCVDFTDE